MAATPFVHCHLHSQYSLLDGAIKIDPLFERAVALGMPAVSLTDHGNLFGAVEFYEAALRAGVKPIIGCEVYVASGSRFDKEKRERDESGFDAINHLILLAMNDTGYKNLIYLVSKAYLEGFYYKPRIDLDLLRQRHEGLIATSGCLSSMVSRAITGGQTETAWKLVEDFAGDLRGALLPRAPAPRHRRPGPRQRRAREDVDRHESAAARHQRCPLPEPPRPRAPRRAAVHRHGHELSTIRSRFRFDGEGFYLKSGDEMAEVFRDHPIGGGQHPRGRRALQPGAGARDGRVPPARVPGSRRKDPRGGLRGAVLGRAARTPEARPGRAHSAALLRVRKADGARDRRHQVDGLRGLLPDRRGLHRLREAQRHSRGPGTRLGRREPRGLRAGRSPASIRSSTTSSSSVS